MIYENHEEVIEQQSQKASCSFFGKSYMLTYIVVMYIGSKLGK